MYKIISGRDESELAKSVSEHLSAGWQVTGGVSHKDGRIFQPVYMVADIKTIASRLKSLVARLKSRFTKEK